MVQIRLVDAEDADNTIDEYESEIIPRVDEILAWTPDSGQLPVYRVLEVRHWRYPKKGVGNEYVGMLVRVEEIPWERRWDTLP